MKKVLIFAFAFSLMASCNRVNPFFETWDTPYGIPPYEKIKVSDYMPALKEGMKQQNAAVGAILDCVEAPTFDNKAR